MGDKKKKAFIKAHPLVFLVVFSVLAGIVLTVCWGFFDWLSGLYSGTTFHILGEILLGGIITGGVLGVAVILPVLLLLSEMIGLYRQIKGKPLGKSIRAIDLTAILLGILYNILFLSMLDNVVFQSDWNEVLYNAQKHTPVYTESNLTIWVIIGLGILGYLFVSYVALSKMPPLVLVIGFSAMYLGTGTSILWAVQIYKGETITEILFLILPVCCLCITGRTVLYKMKEWKEMKRQGQDYGILSSCNRFLENADHWPAAAFLLMWPLLGVVIAILMLFGQKPDAIIKAWTETSDWNLSQRTAPQNLYKDEHYLCTVAAGGHENVVKPIRLGVRHGHEVIVNRQLCVANAFEQILEEKTPRFHKVVRGIYDNYGFPIAKLIRSKGAVDVIYIIMKPAEWFFLIVLYLVDVNPENRIAIQYTGKRLEEFYNEDNCDY